MESGKVKGIVWSAEDSKAAVADGWDVFDHDVRGLEIERIDDSEEADDPPCFPDDADAIWHVYNMARGGSALHQKALYVTLLAMGGFQQTFGAIPSPEADGPTEKLIEAQNQPALDDNSAYFGAHGTNDANPQPAFCAVSVTNDLVAALKKRAAIVTDTKALEASWSIDCGDCQVYAVFESEAWEDDARIEDHMITVSSHSFWIGGFYCHSSGRVESTPVNTGKFLEVIESQPGPWFFGIDKSDVLLQLAGE